MGKRQDIRQEGMPPCSCRLLKFWRGFVLLDLELFRKKNGDVPRYVYFCRRNNTNNIIYDYVKTGRAISELKKRITVLDILASNLHQNVLLH